MFTVATPCPLSERQGDCKRRGLAAALSRNRKAGLWRNPAGVELWSRAKYTGPASRSAGAKFRAFWARCSSALGFHFLARL